MTSTPTRQLQLQRLSWAPRRHNQVDAMTLIELLAVVMIIGILSTVVISRLGIGGIGNPGARAIARRLALDLRQTRSRAIAESANHYLQFETDGSNLVAYTIYKVASPSDLVVETSRKINAGVTVTGSATRAEFAPTGAAPTGYSYTVTGSTVGYVVSVIAVTGAVMVSTP